MAKIKAKTTDEYILNAPPPAQEKLMLLRAILKEVAPHAKESIKWGQPVLENKRILFSYSAYKSHLNFMPTGPTLIHFAEELQAYKKGKDTIQFSYDQELPIALIRKIALFRLKDVEKNGALWKY